MDKEQLIAKFENDVKKRSYILRLLLVIDQFFNVLIWNGSQDETVSSHMGRRIKAGKANKAERVLCGLLRKFESEHCEKSLGE